MRKAVVRLRECTEVINGEDFLTMGIRELCKANDIEYNDNLTLEHVKYNKERNEDYQYNLIKSIVYDGTSLLADNKMLEMFDSLAFVNNPLA